MPRLITPLFLLMLSGTVIAQEESQVEAAKQLYDLIPLQELVAEDFRQMTTGLISIDDFEPLDETRRRYVENLFAELAAIPNTDLNREAIEQHATEFFAEAFELEEIDSLVGFYRSPVGRKVVSSYLELQRISQQIASELIVPAYPQITETLSRLNSVLLRHPPSKLGAPHAGNSAHQGSVASQLRFYSRESRAVPSVSILIDASGNYWLEELTKSSESRLSKVENRNLDELTAVIGAAVDSSTTAPVYIVSDTAAPFGSFVSVVDRLRQLDLYNIGIIAKD